MSKEKKAAEALFSDKEAAAKATDDALTRERDERCVPVAREVLRIIAAHEGPLGLTTDRKSFEDSYAIAAKKVLERFLISDIQLKDIEHVKQLTMQAIDWTLNIVTATVQQHVITAEKKAFGLTLGDMKLEQLDKVLKGEEGGLLPPKKE